MKNEWVTHAPGTGSWGSLPRPCHTKLLGGILVSLRPSVPHPVSALYRLQFWLDPFDIYTPYQATSEGVWHVKFLAKFKNLNFWQFFKICNFDFVLF